ncbi:uncharacterized protein FYW47_006188 [Aplochiton taeniatus]
MEGFMSCVFVIMMVTSAKGEEKLDPPVQQDKENLLKCFRCDLGFWDACYTTTTNCSSGEKCYTGRGKAADVLDVKMLGCAKAEECETETTMELFTYPQIYVMTKTCCDTPFCNAAHTLSYNTLLQLTVTSLSITLFI